MKIIKRLLIALVLLAIIGAAAMWYISEPKPTGTNTQKGDALALKMLAALNKPGWDTLQVLTWEFPGGHSYIWDKQANKAVISWSDHEVTMLLDDQTGTATTSGVVQTAEQKQKLLDKAWEYWCNDSFWLMAPYKVFDAGTTRTIVPNDSKDALLVSYKSGGVTPGDAYLWILGDDYIPTAYKMWVKIIPIGGLTFTWEGWKTLPSGAKVATVHKSALFPMELTGVAEANTVAEALASRNK